MVLRAMNFRIKGSNFDYILLLMTLILEWFWLFHFNLKHLLYDFKTPTKR